MESILRIKGFLLDMDGLLLDTEKVSRQCWVEAEEETGFRMPPGFYSTLIGQSMARIRERLPSVMDPLCNIDDFLAVAGRIYTAALTDFPVPVKPGAPELLEILSRKGIPCCLATSTHRVLCEHKLESSGLGRWLPLRVCGDDVALSKPAPDIYLEAARRTGFAPGELLVLEDSENGIRSALAAGCRVAHIPDIAPVSMEWQVRVDRVYRGLADVLRALERDEIRIC
jgi:HAD superfamily hydrolase (TIGR01509 family)